MKNPLTPIKHSTLSFSHKQLKEPKAKKQNEPPICPFCEFRETEVDKNGNVLLCETCARDLADACDQAHHINCCDW